MLVFVDMSLVVIGGGKLNYIFFGRDGVKFVVIGIDYNVRMQNFYLVIEVGGNVVCEVDILQFYLYNILEDGFVGVGISFGDFFKSGMCFIVLVILFEGVGVFEFNEWVIVEVGWYVLVGFCCVVIIVEVVIIFGCFVNQFFFVLFFFLGYVEVFCCCKKVVFFFQLYCQFMVFFLGYFLGLSIRQ